jgi:protein BUR2
MGMKLMLFDEWSRSVHQDDGLTKEKERVIRNDVVSFMTLYGIYSGLPQITISKGIFIFHKYSKIVSFKKFDFILYAAACIFLIAKLDDKPKELKESIKLYDFMYKTYKKLKDSAPEGALVELRADHFSKEAYTSFKIDQSSWKTLEEKFVMAESDILKITGYDFEIELPYKYLDFVKTMKFIPDATFLKITNNFINDSWRTTVCLYYEPRLITLAALNMAQSFCHQKLDDLDQNMPWYTCFGGDIEKKEIEDVTNHILDVYKQSGP